MKKNNILVVAMRMRSAFPIFDICERNFIKAHAVSGEVTMNEHIAKMHYAVQKAVANDDRFCTPSPDSQYAKGMSTYKPTPYVLDETTPDEKGQMHAIISTAAGKLVRHGFDFNKDLGVAKLVDGDSKPTESTRVYASSVERHENMIRASHEVISCRSVAGTKLDLTNAWEEHKPVSFVYVPGGISTISAGFRNNESITCTVEVDEQTAVDLQESFDYMSATEKQEPYADEDHEAKKATLRFPSDKVKFCYGKLRDGEGVIVKGAEPTSYGADSVNGKVYRSWSPEFATDADYTKAKCKKKHWTFPEGVRGSASNPARIVAVSFVTGALTNKPAFRNMPPVKAKLSQSENETPYQKFYDAVKNSEVELIAELKDLISAAALADKRYVSEKCVALKCDEESGHDFLSTVVKANDGKFYEIPFDISYANEKGIGKFDIGLGEGKEVSDEKYVSAFDSNGYCLNGELIQAVGTSNGVKKGWENRHKGFPSEDIHGNSFGGITSDEATKRIKRHDSLSFKAKSPAEFQAHQHSRLAYHATENAFNREPHQDEEAMHAAAGEMHRQAGAMQRKSGNAEHATEHETTGAHHGTLAENLKWDKAGRPKIHWSSASNKNVSPLDAIFARHESERAAAEAIAMKSPEVQAREVAAKKQPEPTVEAILARQKTEREFESILIARNPVISNREALEAIAARN